MSFSAFIPPLLPTLVNEPPAGPAWEHEIKYDGYRTMVALAGGNSHASTRRGFDWSARYSPIFDDARSLACQSAYLDGEVIVQDTEGRSDFSALQADLQAGRSDRLVYCVFDLLELDGEDLRAEPLQERRARLQGLVGHHSPDRRIQFSEALGIAGAEMLQTGCALGLEGIVSKRLTSRYRSGRQTSWLKSKCFAEEVLVIVGADRQPGKPAYALLARQTADGLAYAGSAFVTLSGEERDRFWTFAETHRRETPALRMPAGKTAMWMEPRLLGEVQYLKGSDKLRHASLRHLCAAP